VLQCLSHTPALRRFFLSGRYVEDINTTNIWSKDGDLAKAFADFLQAYWNGDEPSVRPTAFLQQLGRCAPHLVDHCQQDAQELLTFLIDNLHEDLNRVEDPEHAAPVMSEDHQDESQSQQSWRRHTQCNQSIIVDLLHGQLKSRLTCQKCRVHNVSFDPFVHITLPIPIEERRFVLVTAVRASAVTLPPIQFGLNLDPASSLTEISSFVAREMGGVPVEDIMLLQMGTTHEVSRVLQGSSVEEALLPPKGIYAYHIPGGTAEGANLVQIFLRPARQVSLYGETRPRNDFLPQIVSFNPGVTTNAEFYNLVFRLVSPLLLSGSTSPRQSGLCWPFVLRLRGSAGRDLPNDEALLRTGGAFEVAHVHWQDEAVEVLANRTRAAHIEMHSTASQPTPDEARVTLEDCFHKFTKEEILRGDEKWFCVKCLEEVEAEKKLDLWRMPDVLVLHLKRYMTVGQWREKIEIPIEYPARLDLSHLVQNQGDEGSVYELYATCSHEGGLDAGHYTASCYNSLTGEWYHFDDHHVGKVAGPAALSTSTPYMLFYKREGSDQRIIEEERRQYFGTAERGSAALDGGSVEWHLDPRETEG